MSKDGEPRPCSACKAGWHCRRPTCGCAQCWMGPIANQRQSFGNVVCRPVAEDAARTAVIEAARVRHRDCECGAHIHRVDDIAIGYQMEGCAHDDALGSALIALDALRAMEKP